MSKLFFQNYHYHYGKVKCCQNVNFEEIDIECSTGKITDFYHYGNVMKNKFSYSCHLQIDKKINVREDPGKKADSNFNFSQAA